MTSARFSAFPLISTIASISEGVYGEINPVGEGKFTVTVATLLVVEAVLMPVALLSVLVTTMRSSSTQVMAHARLTQNSLLRWE